MDPSPDPALLAAQPPTVAPASPTAAAAVANPIPTRALTHKHPPYAEMITAAISTLNERNGSSKMALNKYIGTHYSNLPPTHLSLLAHHLKRLKISGQILMVKNSYKLPESAPLAVNGADPVSARPKRRPGRPPKPKPKPDAIQAPVPVFAPQPQNGDIGQALVNVPLGPVNGSGRGRGRPPGRGGFKPKDGQLPTSGGGGGGGGRRGRGRPKAVVAVRKMSIVGRPRGRPPKPINVVAAPSSSSASANVGGGVVATITGKRRGRPPRADGEPKKPRKISAKPLGRPRKNEAAAATRTPDSQLLVAYLDLKSQLEYLQLKVKQTVTSIVPSLVNEAAINALQELEHVALNVNAPPRIVQIQQLPQPQS